MSASIIAFPQRGARPQPGVGNVIQFNRHGAFSLADVQAIRNHFTATTEPGRVASLRWSFEASRECVRISDHEGALLVTFGVDAGTFNASGPITRGRVLEGEASLEDLLARLEG